MTDPRFFFSFTRCDRRYCYEHHPGVQYQTIVSRKIFTDESACLVCTYLVIVLTALLLLLLLMPLSSSPLLSPDLASVCISLAVSAARNDNTLLSDDCYREFSRERRNTIDIKDCGFATELRAINSAGNRNYFRSSLNSRASLHRREGREN